MDNNPQTVSLFPYCREACASGQGVEIPLSGVAVARTPSAERRRSAALATQGGTPEVAEIGRVSRSNDA